VQRLCRASAGPATFFDTELKGGAPGIANNLIPLLIEKLAPEFTIKPGRVYVQMRGPRFETKAEIRIVKDWGDVIGMTAAYEADLSVEAGLRYNSLAIVDNYANGIEGAEIDFVRFKGLVKSNQDAVNRLFRRLLEVLGVNGRIPDGRRAGFPACIAEDREVLPAWSDPARGAFLRAIRFPHAAGRSNPVGAQACPFDKLIRSTGSTGSPQAGSG